MRSLKEFLRQEDILPVTGTGLLLGALASSGAASIGPLMVEPEVVARSIANDPNGLKAWIFIGSVSVAMAVAFGAIRALWGLRPMRWRNSNSFYNL